MMKLDSKHITLKVSEASLRSRNPEMSILHEVSDLLATHLRLEDVLGQCLSKVLAFFQMDSGRIYLLDEEGAQMRLFSYRGIDPHGLESVRIDTGFSGKAVRTKSFIAQHVSELEDRERVDLLIKRGLRIVMCVPLMSKNRVLGVMNLSAGEPMELDPQKIDLLTMIGNQVAVAVDNARLYADLEMKLSDLKEKKDLITFFAYSISHDLKSPAASLHALTHRLKQKYASLLDAKGREHCDLILRTAAQMLALVEMINAYIAAKEAPLHLEEVILDDVVHAIWEEFSHQLTDRGVRVLSGEELPSVVADRMGITRIFRNLVDNALKHGGEVLSEIHVGYERDGAFHRFYVSDDGVGVPEEGRERLFELFERRKDSNGVAGTGMGLAIVREMVKRHAGCVWLDPDLRKGARFCFTIAADFKPAQAEASVQDGRRQALPDEKGTMVSSMTQP